jgi:hypothetical protein
MRKALIGVLVATFIGGVAGSAPAQSLAALAAPRTDPEVARPMTSERIAWLQSRCAQLVAFFDYYGVSGARNHTRIGAVIDCERANYRNGIGGMAALLKRKAFELPKPGLAAIEPEDIDAPDILNPTRP